MLLHLTQFLKDLNLSFALEVLLSAGMGLGGFFVAYVLQIRGLKNKWFTTLRYILSIMSISAISNVYSLLLIGEHTIRPSVLLLNSSWILLILWAILYYSMNIVGPGTSLTPEKVLKFIEKEHQ